VVGAGGLGRCGLVRYLGDGRPDPSFGAGGFVDTEAQGLPRPQALALTADGSVLIAGWDAAAGALRLARYTAAGVLDPSFGAAGVATLAVPAAS
jgi:hypothetical protein